ncbi:hypothetical protein GLOTRDRAFT_128861 [Gloeophyllum trabeum ATCC 11539]|uniref:CsbD-like domain-containing protein n=1 Tax=Gloeophyllum trabeum (strain ATCC 11539 / FP-39264 / Madison 617) TaxID=670483 RepID=S7RRN6_GLOTA|nr:uncharacterized protein GLOTRDRAFT_128861 [Gloeophyllum trabeum ATCC 11539]EPQ55639.1 hypothetical protein GLOTRDRAFT_128861 [Gloeophyllum trabeum ATCC 11539]
MSAPQAPHNTALFEQDRPPTHRVHHSEDPLPGTRGVAPAADYSAEATEHFDDQNVPRPSGQVDSAVDEQRPLGTAPTTGGGVAIGGEEDLPMGKAGLGDKIVGKTQKVVGKVAKNPEMHEKGELREAGGKAAAQGQARAPHD